MDKLKGGIYGILLLLVLVIITLSVLLFRKPNYGNGEAHSEAFYDSLEIRYRLVKDSVATFKLMADSAQVKIDVLQTQLSQSKESTTKIIYRRDEKLRLIVNYAPNQLDSFMSTINIEAEGNTD